MCRRSRTWESAHASWAEFVRLFSIGLCVATLGSLSDTAHAQVSRLAWPSLERPASVRREESSDAAVIVALERYERLPAIPGARANAENWYSHLTYAMGVSRQRITTLYDQDATEYAILNAVRERAGQITGDGRLWFVFIGHGAPSRPDTQGASDGLLVGYEGARTAEGLERRSVRRSELMAALSGATRAVAVLDACFSGQSASGPLAPGLMPLALVDDRQVPTNVTVLTAARADEFAGPLPGSARPAFSYLVLGGLRGWADGDRDGRVTAGETVAYARETLSTALRGERLQQPTLISGDDQTVLAEGAEPAPNLRAILDGAHPQLAYVSTYRPSPSPVFASQHVPVGAIPVTTPVLIDDDADAAWVQVRNARVRAISLTVAAIGGTTALVGLGLWKASSDTTDNLRGRCPTASDCPPSLEADFDRAQTFARMGNVLVPVGAGLAVTGLVTYFIARAFKPLDLSKMSLVMDRHGAVVSVGGRL